MVDFTKLRQVATSFDAAVQRAAETSVNYAVSDAKQRGLTDIDWAQKQDAAGKTVRSAIKYALADAKNRGLIDKPVAEIPGTLQKIVKATGNYTKATANQRGVGDQAAEDLRTKIEKSARASLNYARANVKNRNIEGQAEDLVKAAQTTASEVAEDAKARADVVVSGTKVQILTTAGTVLASVQEQAQQKLVSNLFPLIANVHKYLGPDVADHVTKIVADQVANNLADQVVDVVSGFAGAKSEAPTSETGSEFDIESILRAVDAVTGFNTEAGGPASDSAPESTPESTEPDMLTLEDLLGDIDHLDYIESPIIVDLFVQDASGNRITQTNKRPKGFTSLPSEAQMEAMLKAMGADEDSSLDGSSADDDFEAVLDEVFKTLADDEGADDVHSADLDRDNSGGDYDPVYTSIDDLERLDPLPTEAELDALVKAGNEMQDLILRAAQMTQEHDTTRQTLLRSLEDLEAALLSADETVAEPAEANQADVTGSAEGTVDTADDQVEDYAPEVAEYLQRASQEPVFGSPVLSDEQAADILASIEVRNAANDQAADQQADQAPVSEDTAPGAPSGGRSLFGRATSFLSNATDQAGDALETLAKTDAAIEGRKRVLQGVDSLTSKVGKVFASENSDDANASQTPQTEDAAQKKTPSETSEADNRNAFEKAVDKGLEGLEKTGVIDGLASVVETVKDRVEDIDLPTADELAEQAAKAAKQASDAADKVEEAVNTPAGKVALGILKRTPQGRIAVGLGNVVNKFRP